MKIVGDSRKRPRLEMFGNMPGEKDLAFHNHPLLGKPRPAVLADPAPFPLAPRPFAVPPKAARPIRRCQSENLHPDPVPHLAAPS